MEEVCSSETGPIAWGLFMAAKTGERMMMTTMTRLGMALSQGTVGGLAV